MTLPAPLRFRARAAISLLCTAVSVGIGYSGGTWWREACTGASVAVFGCGVSASFRVPLGTKLELHDAIKRIPNLPDRANGALIQQSNLVYYVRRWEMSATNGIGRMHLTGGESIHFVHRSD